MSWTIDYLPEPGVVSIRTTGSMNLDQLRHLMRESIAEGARHGATKFLVDHRDMTPDLQTADIYHLPEISLTEGVERSFQVAIVYSPEAARSKDFEFYEVRAQNFGYDHTLFTTPQAAMEWLSGSDAQ
jgi:hypothetical protein